MKKFLIPAAAIACSGFRHRRLRPMAPTKTGDSAKGKVLTDGKGMTLYTFDKDAGGKSACNGACATNWPPLMAAADAKGGARLHHHQARRRRQAMGLQGQAALHLEERQEAGRHHRRRLPQRRLAYRQAVRLKAHG